MDEWDLVRLSPAKLAAMDIAETNLLCAADLPDAHPLNIPFWLCRVDKWAAQIKEGTIRVRRRFRENPKLYDNSYDVFRVVIMATCLQKTLGVNYDEELVGLPTDDPATWRPFNKSRHLFIHGPLDLHGGTCVSLPFLYTAIGRRLGYPIKIALSNGHIYCRWETWRKHDSFNIESTARGLNLHPTSHYLKWPFPLSPGHLAKGCFLRSLTPREELAVMIGERGRYYAENFDWESAVVSLLNAESLWPENGLFAQMRWCCESGMLRRKWAMQQSHFTILA